MPSSGTISQIQLPNGNIYDLVSGGAKNVWYGTCSSSSSATVMAVTTTSGDFSLTNGNMIRVMFTNSPSANNVQLNVDSTGDISIIRGYNTYGTSDSWAPGEVVDFVYDSTEVAFVMVDAGHATVQRYGVTKLLSSVSSTSTLLAATPSSVKTAYDLANSKSNVQIIRW